MASGKFSVILEREIENREVGRPKIEKQVQNLIRQMSQENPLWGVPRIHAELHLLGHDVSESTVARYRIKSRKPPSQTWRTFLKNHLKQTVAVDFFAVPTIHFRILYCFVILHHDRREIVHFNVTAHPTALWTAQPVVNAFPEETVPKYLIRDRDSIYGEYFRQRIKNLGIKEVIIAPRSPGKIPMWSGLSARFGVSVWIMSLFSAKIICGKHCGNILNITIKSERISPWTETRRSLEKLSQP